MHATSKELLASPENKLLGQNSVILSKFVIQEDHAREALSDRMKDLVTELQSGEELLSLNFSKYDDYKDREDQALGQVERVLTWSELNARTHTLFSYCVAYWNYHCSQAAPNPDVVESLTTPAIAFPSLGCVIARDGKVPPRQLLEKY